jgi:hypothetical protein
LIKFPFLVDTCWLSTVMSLRVIRIFLKCHPVVLGGLGQGGGILILLLVSWFT